MMITRSFQAIFFLTFLASHAVFAFSYKDLEKLIESIDKRYDSGQEGDSPADIELSPVEIKVPSMEKKATEQRAVSVVLQTLIVTLHEKYRAQVQSTNMMKLRYHDGVATKAQVLADKCVFAHDNPTDRAVAELPGVFIGQNICRGPSTWTDCINAWGNEKNNFLYGNGSKNGLEVGHYTQMMLWKTSAVGCGYNACGGTPIYVCNYAYGQYLSDMKTPWKAGNQCSDCPNSCTSAGFCDCGGTFCNSEYMTMAPTCKCEYWWTL